MTINARGLLCVALALAAAPADPGRGRVDEEACRANLARLSAAVKTYRLLYDKNPATFSELYYKGFVERRADFVCPSPGTKVPTDAEIDARCDFTLDPLPGGKEVLVREKVPHYGPATLLAAFPDGSIQAVALAPAPAAAPPAAALPQRGDRWISWLLIGPDHMLSDGWDSVGNGWDRLWNGDGRWSRFLGYLEILAGGASLLGAAAQIGLVLMAVASITSGIRAGIKAGWRTVRGWVGYLTEEEIAARLAAKRLAAQAAAQSPAAPNATWAGEELAKLANAAGWTNKGRVRVFWRLASVLGVLVVLGRVADYWVPHAADYSPPLLVGGPLLTAIVVVLGIVVGLRKRSNKRSKGTW